MRRAIAIITIAFTVIALTDRYYDDGRCGQSGGVYVVGVYRNVCVKPLDLERK